VGGRHDYLRHAKTRPGSLVNRGGAGKARHRQAAQSATDHGAVWGVLETRSIAAADDRGGAVAFQRLIAGDRSPAHFPGCVRRWVFWRRWRPAATLGLRNPRCMRRYPDTAMAGALGCARAGRSGPAAHWSQHIDIADGEAKPAFFSFFRIAAGAEWPGAKVNIAHGEHAAIRLPDPRPRNRRRCVDLDGVRTCPPPMCCWFDRRTVVGSVCECAAGEGPAGPRPGLRGRCSRRLAVRDWNRQLSHRPCAALPEGEAAGPSIWECGARLQGVETSLALMRGRVNRGETDVEPLWRMGRGAGTGTGLFPGVARKGHLSRRGRMADYPWLVDMTRQASVRRPG